MCGILSFDWSHIQPIFKSQPLRKWVVDVKAEEHFKNILSEVRCIFWNTSGFLRVMKGGLWNRVDSDGSGRRRKADAIRQNVLPSH